VHMASSSRSARILVVDDEQIIALALAAILEKNGYDVEKAFSGDEAVAKAADFNPDLLLSDVSMGTMTGIEAATQITAKLPRCRVLFLSGHASKADIAEAAPKRMVYSFASKPLHPADLLSALAYMLSGFNATDDPGVISIEPGAMKVYVSDWMKGMESVQC
jgi:CheY-like chemotaxis protein